MKEEGLNRKVCLCWSVSAKNCLYNSSGFSPNQSVFGKNIILPNVTGNVSIGEIEEGNESEMLIVLHRAREIHVQQEADSRIKRALRNNIREHNLELTEPGEEVYYKREEEREWRGPAKVIGRDGKTAVVNHGGTLREVGRVHITRLVKVPRTEMLEEEEDVKKDSVGIYSIKVEEEGDNH